MSEERLRILIEAAFSGKPELDSAKNSLKSLDDNARKTTGGLKNLKENGLKYLAELGAAFGTIAIAAKVGYDALKEGATLILLRDQFDNLAESIHTTSNALLIDLRAATKGMLSDSELIASASQLINLQLGKTQKEVVRLATVIAALGLDMNQVILTFANNSVMRLDALGLSITDVKKRADELTKSGFVGDAFDEAVLQALEAKLVLLGDASLTAAGKLQIFEAQVANLNTTFKVWLAEGLTPYLSLMSGQVSQDVERLTASYLEQEHGLVELIETYKLLDSAGIFKGDTIKESQDSIMRQINLTARSREEFEAAMRAIEAYSSRSLNISSRVGSPLLEEEIDYYWELAKAMQVVAVQADEASSFDRNYRESVSKTTSTVDDAAIRMGIYNAVVHRLSDAYAIIVENAAKVFAAHSEINKAIAESTATYQALHTQIAATEQKMREYFDTALDKADEAAFFTNASDQMVASIDNANLALYEAVAAAGASSSELAIFGATIGVVSEQMAEAALKTALLREGFDNMAAAALADGELTREEIFKLRDDALVLVSTISTLPPLINLEFQTNAHQAVQDANSLADAIARIPTNVSVDVSFNAPTVPTYPGGQQPVPNAFGGWVTGGEPGRDSVPSLLMPGELVIPASRASDINSVIQFANKMGVNGNNNTNPIININIYGQIESTPQAIANAISAKLSPRG